MYKDIHDIISNQVEMDWLGPTEYRDNNICFGIWLLSYMVGSSENTAGESLRWPEFTSNVFRWSIWTAACQVPLPMEFSRQEYWSGLPFLSLGDLPNLDIESGFLALQEDSLPS